MLSQFIHNTGQQIFFIWGLEHFSVLNTCLKCKNHVYLTRMNTGFAKICYKAPKNYHNKRFF